MIEVIAALIRWLALASNMILIGGCVFLAIAGRERAAFDNPGSRSRFCWVCWACSPLQQHRSRAMSKVPGTPELGLNSYRKLA